MTLNCYMLSLIWFIGTSMEWIICWHLQTHRISRSCVCGIFTGRNRASITIQRGKWSLKTIGFNYLVLICLILSDHVRPGSQSAELILGLLPRKNFNIDLARSTNHQGEEIRWLSKLLPSNFILFWLINCYTWKVSDKYWFRKILPITNQSWCGSHC